MNRGRRAAVLLLLLALTATGCSDDGSEGKVPDAARGTRAAPPPAPPRVGACYRLDVQAALRMTNGARPVPCSSRHTAVTVSTGSVRPVEDGHLLAFDSAGVQRGIADRCRRSVDAHVRGTQRNQRLSRVQATWFSPTPDQIDRGALWFRCDLVISAGPALAALPRRTKGLLAVPGAMGRWGTCGTTAPSSAHFQRVLCSARHTWRARTTTTLPAGTAYLSRKAAKVADRRCRDVAAELSPNSTRLRWAFEWPTRDQWKSGQRYGFCWTPG